jgi:glycosyltransferase involved in cell wall biosynthesis
VRHVLTSTPIDFEMFRERAASDKGPSHVIDELAERLGARVVQPGDAPVAVRDRLLALAFSEPEHWAAARAAFRAIEPGDLVFCGDGVGIAAAVVNAATRRKARVATQVMAPQRIRIRVFLTALRLTRQLPLLLVGSSDKAEFLMRSLRVDHTQVVELTEQVDERFFRPSSCPAPARQRPLIASCGLEQRDYDTLAKAVDGRDVDVLVCAASPNYTSRTAVRMPVELPPNMEMRHLEFDTLRELYQHADATVVSLLPNNYSAGLTSLLEAMACHSPTVITRTPGLASDLIDAGLVWGVDPGDPEALWAAINTILSDPAAAADRSERALVHFQEHFTSTVFLDRLLDALTQFHMGHQ